MKMEIEININIKIEKTFVPNKSQYASPTIVCYKHIILYNYIYNYNKLTLWRLCLPSEYH